ISSSQQMLLMSHCISSIACTHQLIRQFRISFTADVCEMLILYGQIPRIEMSLSSRHIMMSTLILRVTVFLLIFLVAITTVIYLICLKTWLMLFMSATSLTSFGTLVLSYGIC